MRWQRDICATVGKDTMTSIVDKLLPVLAEGAAAATAQRGADLRAHMGWADFLRLWRRRVRHEPAGAL